ncbi:pilus assembly protein Flp/PilA [Nocardioides salarius]|uniref:Pilus assembly protein Flp/PilA n=1 Tax=Nocardioides salarius TaxID=374513 RepID=A0ABS2M6I5_9ACTN|nr:Flp family type IVb pilin [Nocardioides salarius]MBM7506780.1 pilus assembly protein Flp/PilA [Nocardioides salarius]
MLQFLMTMIAGQKAKMDERGASAVEYGLLVAGIAAVVITAVFLLGDQLDAAFSGTSDELTENGVTPAPE